MKTLRSAALAAAAVLCASPCMPQDARAKARAGVVMNVTRFVQWPAGALGPRDEALIVAVLGDDAMAESLADGFTGRRVLGHPVEVRRVASVGEAAGAKVLFVGRSVVPAHGALARLARSGVLAMGETDVFLDEGGCARLGEIDHAIHVEIDADVLATASFRISSQLLRIVQVRRALPAAAPRGR